MPGNSNRFRPEGPSRICALRREELAFTLSNMRLMHAVTSLVIPHGSNNLLIYT